MESTLTHLYLISGNLHSTASACKILLVQPSSAASRVRAARSCCNMFQYNADWTWIFFYYTLNSVRTVHWFIQFYIISVSYNVGIIQKILNYSETKSIKRIIMSIMKAF